jgi:hypothetical protein
MGTYGTYPIKYGYLPKKEWVLTQKRMGTYPIKYGYLPKKEWVPTQ